MVRLGVLGHKILSHSPKMGYFDGGFCLPGATQMCVFGAGNTLRI